eukprot:COSAG02_NODE_1929_length_10336_cov_69.703819_6_plen_408_part_00
MPPKKKVHGAAGKTRSAAASAAKKKKAATKTKKSNAEPSPPPLPDDPWTSYKSPHGGKLSAADEWMKIQRRDTGRSVSLSALQLASVADSGQIISERLDKLLAALPGKRDASTATCADVETAREERLDKLQAQSVGIGTETATQPEPEPEPQQEPEQEPEQEQEPVAVLACHSADIAAFKLSEPLRATLIGLDLTDNSLQSISPSVLTQSAAALPSPANTLVLPPGGCWLRSLCLRANDLFCLPPLTSMPKLLHLDLSYNQQLHRVLSPDEQPVREAFAAVPLRSIMLEGIGLTALPPSLTTVGKSSGPGGAPRNVVVLHLGYNLFSTKKAMEEALEGFPRLTDLTIAGNPVSTHLCFTSCSAAPDFCMADFVILLSLGLYAGRDTRRCSRMGKQATKVNADGFDDA